MITMTIKRLTYFIWLFLRHGVIMPTLFDLDHHLTCWNTPLVRFPYKQPYSMYRSNQLIPSCLSCLHVKTCIENLKQLNYWGFFSSGRKDDAYYCFR